jgi:hypothetical protein
LKCLVQVRTVSGSGWSLNGLAIGGSFDCGGKVWWSST